MCVGGLLFCGTGIVLCIFRSGGSQRGGCEYGGFPAVYHSADRPLQIGGLLCINSPHEISAGMNGYAGFGNSSDGPSRSPRPGIRPIALTNLNGRMSQPFKGYLNCYRFY